MAKWSIRLLLLALIVLSAPLSSLADDSNLARQVIAERERLFNAQDYDALPALFSAARAPKQAAHVAKNKEAWASKGLKVENAAIETLKVEGGRAEVQYAYTMAGGKKSERILLVKEGNAWKIDDIQSR